MKNVKLYEEGYDRLTSFLSMEDDFDNEFARYLYKCNGDLEVLNLFVQTLEDTVLELHKLVYDVDDFKVLYADTFGILTCEYYDNRHQFIGAENVTYIDFLCNIWADLKLGKLNKQDAITLSLKLFGDELEGLTDGVREVDTFSLIVKDTQRLVDKVSVGLQELKKYQDESNKNIAEMQELIKQIVVK